MKKSRELGEFLFIGESVVIRKSGGAANAGDPSAATTITENRRYLRTDRHARGLLPHGGDHLVKPFASGAPLELGFPERKRTFLH